MILGFFCFTVCQFIRVIFHISRLHHSSAVTFDFLIRSHWLSNQSRSLKVQWSAQRSQLAQQDWPDWPPVLLSTTSTRELRMSPLTVWCRDSWWIDSPKDLRRSVTGSTVRHLTCVVLRAWCKDLDGRAPQGKQVTSEPRCRRALCVPVSIAIDV